MNKKGFTFIEMLAVVVLLALLVIIAYPIVTNQIKNSNKDLTDAEKEILYSSAYSYIEDNQNDYPIRSGNVFCVNISDLKKAGKIPVTLKHVELEKIVKITVASENDLNYDIVDECSGQMN